MIPYEELVIALQTWRAKQGLPVGQLSGALTPPMVVAPPPPPPRGPPVKPPKMGSTGPQQAFVGNVATPPPLAAPEESLDVDESALIEEAQYENEGGDFAMNFAGAPPADDGESTSVGNVPDVRGSQTTLDDAPEAPSGSSRNRNDDW